jgi:beta-N-acetylhexosaminidase
MSQGPAHLEFQLAVLRVFRSENEVKAAPDNFLLVMAQNALGAGVPALDATHTPATLSHPILTDVLRGELGFDGVIVTDSLSMAALRETYSETQIPVMAIQAGADILLNPSNLPLAYNAVLDAVDAGTITVARLDASVRRILERSTAPFRASDRQGLAARRPVTTPSCRRKAG